MRYRFFLVLGLLWNVVSFGRAAELRGPIHLTLDITDAPRKIFHAHLSMPVQGGSFTLVYPKWIPGEHTPTGPVDELAGIAFWADGASVAWRRDDVDMYALHLNIPAGATKLEASLDFLATAATSGYTSGASTTANLAVVSWNSAILYPAGSNISEVEVSPVLKIPDGWKIGTALPQVSSSGNTIQFQTATLERLVDSPVLAGRFVKRIPLADDVTPKHFLNIAADGPENLKPSSEELESFNNLVREAGALYQSRHYRQYDFLLTLSDSVAHFGLEHHESSDDRAEARMFLDSDLEMLDADLLPHEFTHSWNGKYRRPEGLVINNYQQPMKGELLWVYEGLTQFLGDVLTVRSRLWTPDQFKNYLAASAADLDQRPGRTWRNLEDTAVSVQSLYDKSGAWDNWRRAVDYYAEGELIWLEVDTTLRKLSGGKKSINDFCASFFGFEGNTGPKVVPYKLDDIVKILSGIQPHDWNTFFQQRLTGKSNHAPTAGVIAAGYRLEYTGEQNDSIRAAENRDRALNAWYSLGLRVDDGTVGDVLLDSPAYKAGVGPGMKLVAVNGRRYSDELLRKAICDTKTSDSGVELILENTGYFKVVKIAYKGGERYPHLVRDSNAPAFLDELVKPLVQAPSAKSAAAFAVESRQQR